MANAPSLHTEEHLSNKQAPILTGNTKKHSAEKLQI